MRATVLWSLLLVAVLFVAAGCSNNQETKDRIAEACERQNEQLKEEAEESKTKEADSSKQRTEEEHLVECAGQPVYRPEASDEQSEGGEGAGMGEDAEGGAAEGATMLTAAELTTQRDTFSKTCGSCHALGDAKTTGNFGPNLDETDDSVEDMKEQIENGGGGMPAGLLTGDDAQAMADYIAQVRAAK